MLYVLAFCLCFTKELKQSLNPLRRLIKNNCSKLTKLLD